MGLWDRIFGQKKETAKSVAKDRLQMVLKQDRASIPAPMMEQLRLELLEVVRRYLDIEETDLDVAVHREGEAVALSVGIPIRRVRTEAVI